MTLDFALAALLALWCWRQFRRWQNDVIGCTCNSA